MLVLTDSSFCASSGLNPATPALPLPSPESTAEPAPLPLAMLALMRSSISELFIPDMLWRKIECLVKAERKEAAAVQTSGKSSVISVKLKSTRLYADSASFLTACVFASHDDSKAFRLVLRETHGEIE